MNEYYEDASSLFMFQSPKGMSKDCGKDNSAAKDTAIARMFAQNKPDQEQCKMTSRTLNIGTSAAGR